MPRTNTDAKSPRPVRSMTAMMAYNSYFAMVRCARRLRDRRGHPSRPCRSARRGRTVHLAGLLVMSAGRQDHRRTRQGSVRHRAEHADRLLGLSRLEGHAGGLALQRAPESLFADARRSRRLHAAGDRQRLDAGDRQRSRQHRRRDQGYRQGRRRDVGAGDDDVVRQADQRFGRREQGAAGGRARRSLDLLGLEGGADRDRARRESRPARSPTTMWCATCSRSATGTAVPEAGPCRWKTSPARASMPRSSMSRTAIATSRAPMLGAAYTALH